MYMSKFIEFLNNIYVNYSSILLKHLIQYNYKNAFHILIRILFKNLERYVIIQ